MLKYIAKRLLTMIALLFGISLISFLIMQLAPGTYLDTMAMNPQISPLYIAHMKEKFGLTLPWYEQYFRWLWGILPHPEHGNRWLFGILPDFLHAHWHHWQALDFGISFARQIPVFVMLKPAMLNTFILASVSVAISWMIALPLGVISAARQNQWLDKAAVFFAYVGFAVPDFFLAILVLYFAARVPHLFPIGGMTSPDYEFLTLPAKLADLLRHLFLPAFVLAVGNVAYLLRQMRAGMLDTLRADYITTARAKGVPEKGVIFRHAFRNALNPMITLFGFECGFLLSGALAVEIVMSWPGLGRVIYEAIIQKDLYVVMGDLMLSSFLLIAGNLLADILLAWSDPRIRYE